MEKQLPTKKMIFNGDDSFLLRNYVAEWRRLDKEFLRCRNEQMKVHEWLIKKAEEEWKIVNEQREFELEILRIISKNKNF